MGGYVPRRSVIHPPQPWPPALRKPRIEGTVESCQGCGACVIIDGACAYCRRVRRPERGPPPTVPVAPGGRPVRMTHNGGAL